jgi:hypothetical protein
VCFYGKNWLYSAMHSVSALCVHCGYNFLLLLALICLDFSQFIVVFTSSQRRLAWRFRGAQAFPLLRRKDAMLPGWWIELRCDSVCLRSRHLSAWPCSRHTTDSAAPALRWAEQLSSLRVHGNGSPGFGFQSRIPHPRTPGQIFLK